MMRTPKHLDAHAESLVAIWRTGWGIRQHRVLGGALGVYIRLEKGILFRGGHGGWWWRPTLTQAMRAAVVAAAKHPLHTPPAEGEWG